jgi:S1-C subfamily serine protease
MSSWSLCRRPWQPAGGAALAGDRVSSVAVASVDEGSALQQRFVSIVKSVSPAVVQVRTSVALGSGVVFDARGDVVTNAHVMGDATRYVVTLASGDTVQEPANVNLSSVIQTSAAINPGNSGGALVDLSGQVIGIPTLAAIDPEMGAEAPGIGFAIDSDTVRQVADRLVRTG